MWESKIRVARKIQNIGIDVGIDQLAAICPARGGTGLRAFLGVGDFLYADGKAIVNDHHFASG
jgi:hypothetical protein